jgi:hypothetical protein
MTPRQRTQPFHTARVRIAFATAIAIVAASLMYAASPWGRDGRSPAAHASGGDFSLDFVASAPFTYDHTTGGGVFDDRNIGKSDDVVESLEAGDFQCGEIVSYLVQVVTDAEAPGSQTIRLTNAFTADTTGQPGAGHSEIVGVMINDPATVTGGDQGPKSGPGADTGFIEQDGGSIDSTITNVTKFVDPASSALWPAAEPDAGAVIGVTYDVTGLEAGDHVIVRIDTRLSCGAETSPTGNLQAALTGSDVVAPPDQAGTITRGSGNQTIPFKQFGELVINTPTPTSTSVPPTPTNTSVPPTPTNTSVPPTPTNTSVPPTATNTPVATNTTPPHVHTATPTNTRTATATVAPATATPTKASGVAHPQRWRRTAAGASGPKLFSPARASHVDQGPSSTARAGSSTDRGR